jgi:hypothetical protein
VKKSRISNDSYLLINLLFAGIILAVIAYSLVFGGEKTHPVPSGSELLTGKHSFSTGLSRSFSAIVRLNFEQARAYNPYGLRIFMFFLAQLVMRVTAFFLTRYLNRPVLIITDTVLSVLLFIVLFWPFIVSLGSEL